jgi:hypothetical protein
MSDFGDDVDESTARGEAVKFSLFERVGLKPPLCVRHPDMCNLLNDIAIASVCVVLFHFEDLLHQHTCSRVVIGQPAHDLRVRLDRDSFRDEAATRAPECTAMPPTSSPINSHSPVCRPVRICKPN